MSPFVSLSIEKIVPLSVAEERDDKFSMCQYLQYGGILAHLFEPLHKGGVGGNLLHVVFYL